MNNKKFAFLSAMMPVLAYGDDVFNDPMLFDANARRARQDLNFERRVESDEKRMERIEAEKRRLAAVETARKLAQGLKPFDYPEGTVWALNWKNADRKARNLGWCVP